VGATLAINLTGTIKYHFFGSNDWSQWTIESLGEVGRVSVLKKLELNAAPDQ
jgi:hypothetical protein